MYLEIRGPVSGYFQKWCTTTVNTFSFLHRTISMQVFYLSSFSCECVHLSLYIIVIVFKYRLNKYFGFGFVL